MSNSSFLFLAVFLACSVEMVEASTIVLAIGTTRGWRSGLLGAGAALVALAVIVGGLGPAVLDIPLSALRLVVGGLLLVFGLSWLRKAILRASGWQARHDEEVIYAAERARSRAAGETRDRFDGYAFVICFKGVLLEGLEVAFIVLTFGANQKDLPLASIAAVAALVVVLAVAVAVRAPLSRVPENTMKFVVGTMLTSFGTFWGAEGAGVHWPGGDAALLGLVPGYVLVSLGLVGWLRRLHDAVPAAAPAEIGVAAR